jgi:hypothetical protein
MAATYNYDIGIHSSIMGYPQRALSWDLWVVERLAAMLCIAAGRASNPWFDGGFGGQGDCYQPVTGITKGVCKAGLALGM